MQIARVPDLEDDGIGGSISHAELLAQAEGCAEVGCKHSSSQSDCFICIQVPAAAHYSLKHLLEIDCCI